jgi:nicotinamide-nucleotide amidase
MEKINATIITIGDELLIGQTIDTNSAWLGTHLNDIGVWIQQRLAVGDNSIDINNALDIAIAQSQIVIITGGLGPTADDITKPLLCKYFGGTLQRNKDVEAHVTAFFTKRNRPIIDVNLKQADVPNNATVLWNRYGTAPGMLFTQAGKLIFALPGVPLEMKDIMEQHGFNAIKQHFTLPQIMHYTICTAGKGESFLAAGLKRFEQHLPTHIKLAYLPNLGQVKLRLTSIDGSKEALMQQADTLYNTVQQYAYAKHDISLEEVIAELLINNKLNLSIAESCTGGALANVFTNISGSSNFLNGTIVSYSNAIKQNILGIDARLINEYTAMSSQVAEAMAIQCIKIFNTQLAVSTTGYLEQSGENEPQIWICVAINDKTYHEHQLLPYNRVRNKELAVNFCLRVLHNAILKHIPI